MTAAANHTEGSMAPSSFLRAGWLPAGSLAILALTALGIAHAGTFHAIIDTWERSVTYTHGWLIVPLAAWLVWRRREALGHLRPRVCWYAIAALVGLQLVWLVAAMVEVALVSQLAVVGMVPATVLFLLGARVAWALAFPLVYLVVFAVPWGAGLVPPLQDITARFSVAALQMTGIPVLLEGRVISIPVGDFHVAEACSGVRYLIASLAVGTLYAYLTYRSHWRRALFIVAAAVVPIAANGLRAYGIIMLAHLSDMQLAVGVDHLIYGWVFFGVVIFLLFWVGAWWREDMTDEPTEGQAAASASSFAGGSHPAAHGAAFLFLALIAAAGPASLYALERAQPIPSTDAALPSGGRGWVAADATDARWSVSFRGADVLEQASYRSTEDAAPVRLLVVHYRDEESGAELVTSNNTLYAEPWRWMAEGRREIESGDNTLTVRELRLSNRREERLVWWWYDIGGRRTVDGITAKAIGAVRQLTLQPADATLVAIAADHDGEPALARERLRAFIGAHPEVTAPRGLIEER